MSLLKASFKKSIICSDIHYENLDLEKIYTHFPRSGDVAIFEIRSVGRHKRLQIASGRNATLFKGDLIMAAFGNRYATNQFKGIIPKELLNEFHILGQGGVIGLVHSAHSGMSKPTSIRIVGYVVNSEGLVANTMLDKELDPFEGKTPLGARVILSVGASMDSGKTTTAGHFIRGLKKAGKSVAYIKLTGTVYAKDTNFCLDCGADISIDFSRFGFPSTYMCPRETLLKLYQSLLNCTERVKPDYIIVEIADGIYQQETKNLLNSRRFMQTVYGVLFSCRDSLGALNGVQYLTAIGAQPLALCGTFTISPMLIEEVESLCDLRIATLSDMLKPEFVAYIESPFCPI